MICPNCSKNTEGPWCEHCGCKLEADSSADTQPVTPPPFDFFNPDSESSPQSDSPGRNSIYDDDSAYPYNTSSSDNSATDSLSAGSVDSDDEKYAKQYDDMVKRQETAAANKTKRNIIIISAVTAIILISLAVTIILISGRNENKPETEVISSGEELTDSQEIEKLLKKGNQYIQASDYESAEKIYKQILELDSEADEADTLYTILFNYNKAAKALDEKKYDQARKHCDKIPPEYADYDGLDSDVDYLIEEIVKCETTYEAFGNLAELIDEENYEEAAAALELVDKKRLTDEDRKIFDEYKAEIEDYTRDDDADDNDDGNDSYRQLSRYEAEDLVAEYCNAFVESINKKNFGIVAPYIHNSSTLYSQQKSVVESCIEAGTTERFDGVALNSIKRTGSSAWEVNVTESETIYYASGKSESKTFNWTYTIEYIDSAYYFTKIK